MVDREGFPSPEEVAFMLMDRKKGLAVPLDSLPQEEWEMLRGEILRQVGRGIAQCYLHKNR